MSQTRHPFQCEFEQSTFPYMQQLYRLAYARTGHAQDAEDLVQETYLKAYTAFGSVRRPDKIKSWLMHILLNTIRDYRRKGMRSVDTVDISDFDEDSIPEPQQPGPEEQICRDELDPSLFKALQAIPEAFLTPFLLREIGEATYEEIAKTLDIPAGTVMSRLFRARRMLRTSLMSDDAEADNLICHKNKPKRGSRT